jgi:ABC-2 type transport system permease protein
MKPSVFNPITLRLRLLWINLVNTWQTETAYFGDGWGNMLSTLAYTLTYLVFINVVFANVHTLAGYTRDQMLFLLFINQINFYLIYTWSYTNMIRLVQDVNRGAFDLLLIKPLPALFYSTTKQLSFLSTLRDGLPTLIIFGLAVHWSQVAVTPLNLAAGIIIMAAGQLALNAFFFFLAAPVFWFGQAADVMNLGYPFTSVDLPYEGVAPGIRSALLTLVPCLIQTALAASVMLGKTPALLGLTIAIAVAIGLTYAKIGLWRLALRNYTSASS